MLDIGELEKKAKEIQEQWPGLGDRGVYFVSTGTTLTLIEVIRKQHEALESAQEYIESAPVHLAEINTEHSKLIGHAVAHANHFIESGLAHIKEAIAFAEERIKI